MSVGSLVVSLSADIAQYTSSLDKASALAEQRMKQIDKSIGLVKTSLIALGAGAAAGLTLDKVKEKIEGVIAAAAGMEELSARTGVAVEALSGLASVAKLSNTDTDSLATGMQKLAKSMVDAENGGTKTAAAFKAIGISVKDIKDKSPAEVFQLMAQKAANYQDGAEKLVVAQQLLGKAGANLLPVMKDLSEVSDLQVKLTTAQAEQARQLEQDWKRLQMASDGVWKSLALALVPTMDDFVRQLIETQRQTGGLKNTVDDLAKDHTIRDWAQNAALGLAIFIEALQGVVKMVGALSGSFESVIADMTVAGVFIKNGGVLGLAMESNRKRMKDALDARNKTVEDANKRYVDLWNYNGTQLSDSLRKRFALSNLADDHGISGADQDSENRRHGLNGGRGKIDASGIGNQNKGPKDDPAKAVMDGVLKSNDALIAAEKKQLATREEYLQSFYQQQYISADDYYSTQRTLIEDELQQELKSYAAEMTAATRYLAISDTEVHKQEARNKIAEIAAKQSAAELDASERLTKSVMEQMKAYRDFELQTKNVVYQWGLQNAASQFQIDMLGKNTLEVQKLTAARAIDLQVQQQIHDAEQKGLQGPQLDAKVAELVAAGEEQKARAIELVGQSYQKQTSAAFGAQEALRKYAEDASNIGAQVEGAMTHAFKGMEDALVSFVTTGKMNFKSLADSIISDIARIIIKEQVVGPLAKMMSGAMGADTGAGVSPPNPFASGGGGFLSTAISAIGSMFGGGFADGGDPAVGKVSLVGENGPELFFPRTAGTVVPNDFLQGGGAGGGDMKLTIVNNTSAPIGRVTQRQISPSERALVIEESVNAMALALHDSNSKPSQALSRNYNLRRSV